jgi:hypothetical protein
VSAGAEWLQAQFKVPSQNRRASTLELLDELREQVDEGVYEVSNDAGGAPRLYLRVEKRRKEYQNGRFTIMTWIWILAGSQEIPAKPVDMQVHLLQAIIDHGEKISS